VFLDEDIKQTVITLKTLIASSSADNARVQLGLRPATRTCRLAANPLKNDAKAAPSDVGSDQFNLDFAGGTPRELVPPSKGWGKAVNAIIRMSLPV